jgi:hypothetical protein
MVLGQIYHKQYNDGLEHLFMPIYNSPYYHDDPNTYVICLLAESSNNYPTGRHAMPSGSHIFRCTIHNPTPVPPNMLPMYMALPYKTAWFDLALKGEPNLLSLARNHKDASCFINPAESSVCPRNIAEPKSP